MLTRDTLILHVLLVLAVSVAYESLFLHHGISWMYDEGWPLYAAMQLHAGGELYRDVFFVFPPGHLLPAWLGYAFEPPGIIPTRAIYAAFNVSLSISIYLLGRRLMSPRFALLGALLLAVAAPRSHLSHLLFGYRYLVFGVLALLAFAARLRTGNRRWMLAAGLASGVAAYFRLTPAFAVGCGIAIGVTSASLDWRSWLRDWGMYALGILAILVPVLLYFATGVGLEAVWEHIVVRVAPMLPAQEKGFPELLLPGAWDRDAISRSFVTIQYRLYPMIYVAYLVTLGVGWVRSVRERRPAGDPLLIAVIVFAAVFTLRISSRSDEHHLMSAVPAACLVLAHLLATAFRAARGRGAPSLLRLRAAEWAACALLLGFWVLASGTDQYLGRDLRGIHPLLSTGGSVLIPNRAKARDLDFLAKRIERLTRRDDVVLDLTYAPLLHVITNRRGPGYGDVVTPGVFEDPDDERDFIAKLEERPPALVLWPARPFDRMESRSLEATSPRLAKWIRERYRRASRPRANKIIMLPRAPRG